VLKPLLRPLFVLEALLVLGSFGLAQSFVLDLPRPSQHAVIIQRIGITDVTINYHRPMVNKRKLWGGLVPYGQVWRAGANENTTIKFSDPVTIEGKPLAAGAYGLHMIPGENEWTVIFSRNSTSWGSFTYNQAEDALRVTVKPQAAEFHEALTYDFDDVNPDSTVVTLRWEKVAVPFKVGVNTHEIVEQNLHNQLRGLAQYSWQGWDDAANSSTCWWRKRIAVTALPTKRCARLSKSISTGSKTASPNLMNNSRPAWLVLRFGKIRRPSCKVFPASVQWSPSLCWLSCQSWEHLIGNESVNSWAWRRSIATAVNNAGYDTSSAAAPASARCSIWPRSLRCVSIQLSKSSINAWQGKENRIRWRLPPACANCCRSLTSWSAIKPFGKLT